MKPCITLKVILPGEPVRFPQDRTKATTIACTGVTVATGTTIEAIRDYALGGCGQRVVPAAWCQQANEGQGHATLDRASYTMSMGASADWDGHDLVISEAAFSTKHKLASMKCSFTLKTTTTTKTTITTTVTTPKPTATTTATSTTPTSSSPPPPPQQLVTPSEQLQENNDGDIPNDDNDDDDDTDADTGTDTDETMADLTGSNVGANSNTTGNTGTDPDDGTGITESDVPGVGGDGKTNVGGSSSSSSSVEGCCAFNAPFTSCNSPTQFCNLETNCENNCGGTWFANGFGDTTVENDDDVDEEETPAAAAQANSGGMIAGIVIGVLILILLSIGTTILGYKRCNKNNGNGNINTKENIALASISSNMVTNQAALAPAPARRGPLNNYNITGSSSTDGPDQEAEAGLYYTEPVSLPSHNDLDPDLEGYGHAGAAATYEYAPVVQTIQQSAAAAAVVAADKAAGSAVGTITYATYAPSPAGAGGGGEGEGEGEGGEGDDDGYEMPAKRATSEVVNGVVQPLLPNDAAVVADGGNKVDVDSGGGEGGKGGEGETVRLERITQHNC